MLALRDLLKPDHMTRIANVGEADEHPPYRRMQEEGLCDVGVVVDLPDYIRVSAAGAELAMLQARPQACAHAVAIQTRVFFLPSVGLPHVGMVDTALRTMGFVPHCFIEATCQPIPTDPPLNNVPPNQIVEADMLYVRDWSKCPTLTSSTPDSMTGEQWKQLALIAHHICGSYDLAMYAITTLAHTTAVAADAPARYRNILTELVN